MRIVERADAAAFWDEACTLLAPREVEHNLLLGVLKAVIAGRYPGVVPRIWGVHEDGGELVGAAVHTPPYPMLISAMPELALATVADALLEQSVLPCRIMGLDSVIDEVRARLHRVHGVTATRIARMRLFELLRVTPPPATAGTMRPGKAEDSSTLADYLRAFAAEAVPHEPPPADAEKQALGAIAAGSVFAWEHADNLVCMAACGREVGGGVSIGPVYTPPGQRGRGYASALVAGLSQHLLDRGRRYTCLFTDLSNPVSNKIYVRLGYRPVADFSHWEASL